MTYFFSEHAACIKLAVVTVCSMALLAGGLLLPQVASAQTPPANMPTGAIDLAGYAWSSNIGWISLNCKTGSATASDICATADYRVSINSAGNMTGYAWSSNIGWIKFGGLGGYPIASGNPEATPGANPARVTGTYPNLTFAGFARACSGTLSALGTCSNMFPRTDGWDGWISLKGTGPAYGVTMNATGMGTSSYAWGSDVVGWIDMFTRADWEVTSITLSGSGCTIARGFSSCTGSLSWKYLPATLPNRSIWRTSPASATPFQNIYNQIASTTSNQPVTLSYGTSVWRAQSGPIYSPVRPLSAVCNAAGLDRWSTTTARCEFNASSTVGVTLTIPTIRPFIRSGDTVSLEWDISGVPDSKSCTLTGPAVPPTYMSSQSTSTFSGTFTSTALSSYSTFTLTCTTAGGSDTASVSVEVIPTVTEI